MQIVQSPWGLYAPICKYKHEVKWCLGTPGPRNPAPGNPRPRKLEPRKPKPPETWALDWKVQEALRNNATFFKIMLDGRRSLEKKRVETLCMHLL